MAKVDAVVQVKQFFNKLTKMQKAIISGVIGIVLLGIVLLVIGSSEKKEYQVLFSDLNPSDASAIVENLKSQNIKYELRDQGTTILVDKGIVYDTRLSMARDGLPAQSEAGYEIFDKTNLGMSEFVQKLNYRRALEGELTRTINSLDEVRQVRVHIVIPETALFEKDQKQPSASVTLHLKTGRSISNISVEGIQNLVASSVEGMQTSAVTVVDHRGKVLSVPPIDEKSVGGLTSVQHEQQRRVEQYLSEKVQSMLDGVIGHGNSEVRVNAELDFTQIEKTITDYDPERQVVRSEQSIIENSESSDSLSYPAVNMKKDLGNQISNYEISQTVERIVQEVGNIKRLSVAALINGTQKLIEVEGLKTLEYIPRSDEEVQNLERIIRNAVGFDPTRNDQVTVISVPFETILLDPDSVIEIVLPWWQQPENIKLIALIFAMLFALFMMYKLLQSKPIKDRIRIAFALPEKIKIEEEEDLEEELKEEDLEEISFDDDEFLLLPAELPEQLLLEGDKAEKELEELEEEDQLIDKDALADSAKASLDEGSVELSESALMKIEIKSKVQDYVDEQTNDAVRLVRIFLAQDFDEKILKS